MYINFGSILILKAQKYSILQYAHYKYAQFYPLNLKYYNI